MHTKTVLTILGSDRKPEELDPAIEFCRQNAMHLSVFVIAVSPPPPTMTYGGIPADLWVEAAEAGREKITATCEAVEAHLQKADISCDVSFDISPSGLTDDEIGRRGRYADFTLLVSDAPASDDEPETFREQIIGGALFNSDRPLLLLDRNKPDFTTPKRVLLAWDASRQAAKAAHAAMDFLLGADDVRVVLIDPEPVNTGHGQEPGSDIATFLARHGATVSVDRVAGSGQTIAEALLRHAGDCAADLLVMGGYGHSRLRQRIFGGTTEAMLKQSDFPVFMMH